MGVDTREIGAAKPPEVLTPDIVIRPPSAIEQQTRAEIDVQISTAKRYPRSLTAFKARLRDAVALDRATAASCFYTVPRDGKRISGPSVRLAELAASCYGNFRYGARIMAEDDECIVAQGVAYDLENNVLSSIETRRRIVGRDGKKYSLDMILTTSNAACSVALRNAVLRVIPRALVNEAYEKARSVAAGDAKDLKTGIANAMERAKKLGLTPAQVFGFLDVEGEADITTNHLLDLFGAVTACEEGEATVKETFPATGDVDSAGRRTFGKQAIKPQPPASNGKEQTEQKTTTPPTTAAPAPTPDPVPDPTHAEDTAHTSDRKPASEPPDPGREPKVDRNNFWNEADKALKGNHARAIQAVQRAIDDLKALKKLPVEIQGWQDLGEEQSKMVLDALKGAK